MGSESTPRQEEPGLRCSRSGSCPATPRASREATPLHHHQLQPCTDLKTKVPILKTLTNAIEVNGHYGPDPNPMERLTSKFMQGVETRTMPCLLLGTDRTDDCIGYSTDHATFAGADYDRDASALLSVNRQHRNGPTDSNKSETEAD
ncbi:E3 ubiquitin-protein ligase TRIM69 [Platysternon megacephalum]|uniref:E3 ubiquitin-protein ligase TRIM69 n=1 Tax=Platysternon megacephalum TaxID=55544 RepID=A0A4D9DWY1_9SAUR|nr:E3 ubiquitin-protein ligase TRIM69 [Platysternon megacephalum]